MLRTSGSRGADKMDVLALVRAEECQPVASDDFLDRLWRTAKDELALVVGYAASAGYTQQGDEPEQPCENLSFHFALHLTSVSASIPWDRGGHGCDAPGGSCGAKTRPVHCFHPRHAKEPVSGPFLREPRVEQLRQPTSRHADSERGGPSTRHWGRDCGRD